MTDRTAPPCEPADTGECPWSSQSDLVTESGRFWKGVMIALPPGIAFWAAIIWIILSFK